MVNEVALNFLGTSFKITTDAEEEYLEKVLSQYRAAISQTQSISGISEPLNVAVLTGFMLCDEINRLKQKMEAAADSPEAASNETVSDESASDEAMEIALRTRRLTVLLDQVIDKFDKG
ncbi:MAG: cell division protein ZapA [Treponema sp.]|nr:cell division protein ZapA [Treponema sp.]